VILIESYILFFGNIFLNEIWHLTQLKNLNQRRI